MTNRAALEAGAAAYRGNGRTFGWMPMDSAPRDGTVVEIKNTFGIAPVYSLERWTKSGAISTQDGPKPYEYEDYAWRSPDPNESAFYENESGLFWRPYHGEIENYVDPTGGLQNTSEYWRGAVAEKYGLPVDHFEAQGEANARRLKAQHGRKPWWRRLFVGGR